MEPILKAGDQGFSCGDSKVSKAIRWFTRSKGEPKTKVNHSFLVLRGGTLREAIIIEAVSTVQSGPLYRRYGPPKTDRVAFYRYLPLTAEQAEIVTRAAEDYLDRKYGYHRIAAHVLDFGLSKARGKDVYLFRRLAGMADYPLCSWLNLHSFAKIGVGFGVDVDEGTPDDILDWVEAHPKEHECVRPLTRIT